MSQKRVHTVEKIGGTSMSDYAAVRDNIILRSKRLEDNRNRIFVVSAYGGITDKLLEHKKTGAPGVFAFFANGEAGGNHWPQALDELRSIMQGINAGLFARAEDLQEANRFINERLDEAQRCLSDLERLCQHGHFALAVHLATVREMLASIGEAHSAWNTARLLQLDGVNARFVDLTGWDADQHMGLDERILEAFQHIDLRREIPIVTGYVHTEAGLMSVFDRGYSEMSFSRIAALTEAREAIIHKEYHLSSADPKLVGEDNAVPIGRTNYDVADQLASLGMEAIHPRAAKGLREMDIPLRVKNTFDPEHTGTLVTVDYVSETPCVEIIAGRKGIYAIECFDQNMIGEAANYDRQILEAITRFKGHMVSKDINANTITHYLTANLKTIKRIRQTIEERFREARIQVRKVALVSAIGSDMKVPGMLSKAVAALAKAGISILAMHQSMRQVDMQFVISEDDYEAAIKALHSELVEVHEHGDAICVA